MEITNHARNAPSMTPPPDGVQHDCTTVMSLWTRVPPIPLSCEAHQSLILPAPLVPHRFPYRVPTSTSPHRVSHWAPAFSDAPPTKVLDAARPGYGRAFAFYLPIVLYC